MGNNCCAHRGNEKEDEGLECKGIMPMPMAPVKRDSFNSGAAPMRMSIRSNDHILKAKDKISSKYNLRLNDINHGRINSLNVEL